MPLNRPSTAARPDAPALVVFTLGPGREQARRGWLGARGAAIERAVHEQGLAAVLEAGRANGCRLVMAAPRSASRVADATFVTQAGDSFRERLVAAVATVEAEGSAPLVVVGTDTPGIGRQTVAAALQRVTTRPDSVVVGPSTDGGIYLLAAARPVAALLDRVRWRSTATLRSLVETLETAGLRVHLLEPLRDLDSRNDLEWWSARARLLTGAWRRLLARVGVTLASLARWAGAPRRLRPAEAVAAPAGRAPPL